MQALSGACIIFVRNKVKFLRFAIDFLKITTELFTWDFGNDIVSIDEFIRRYK